MAAVSNWVVLVVGIAALVAGSFIVRFYEEVFYFFRDRRRARFGRLLETEGRFSRPEIMRTVGIVWIAFGTLFVAVGVLLPAR